MPECLLREVILKTIKRRRLTQYRIAADTSIPQPCLSRFMNGGSLKMETASVLLDYLGLEVRPKNQARRQRG